MQCRLNRTLLLLEGSLEQASGHKSCILLDPNGQAFILPPQSPGESCTWKGISARQGSAAEVALEELTTTAVC